MSYYDILNVPRHASQEEIRKAYLKLSLKYHPDKLRNGSDKSVDFNKITKAHDVLKDPHKRRAYNAMGEDFEQYMYGEEVIPSQAEYFEYVLVDLNLPLEIYGYINTTEEKLEYSLMTNIKSRIVCELCVGRGTNEPNPSICAHCKGEGHTTGKSGKVEPCGICFSHGYYIDYTWRCNRCGGLGFCKVMGEMEVLVKKQKEGEIERYENKDIRINVVPDYIINPSPVAVIKNLSNIPVKFIHFKENTYYAGIAINAIDSINGVLWVFNYPVILTGERLLPGLYKIPPDTNRDFDIVVAVMMDYKEEKEESNLPSDCENLDIIDNCGFTVAELKDPYIDLQIMRKLACYGYYFVNINKAEYQLAF